MSFVFTNSQPNQLCSTKSWSDQSMEKPDQQVQNQTKKPADSKRSAGRGGKNNIILPVVRYHPSITHSSHQGRGPGSDQKTCPAQKPDQKLDKKPAQKPDQKLEKKPTQKPDQKLEKKPAQKPDQKLDKKPAQKIQDSRLRSQKSERCLLPRPEELGLDGRELESSVVEEVEVLTRGQRENPAWFDWRKNRLTASNVHRIAHSRFVAGTSRAPLASYLSDITGHGSRVQTKAMKWGVDMEARAVKEYQVLKSKLLGRDVVVQDSGLFIDPKRPWLAATPDGIVMDRLSGQRLLCLEVKCPFKHRGHTVEEACREDREFCLQIKELPRQLSVEEELPRQTAYQLKQNHSYYSQIQCQLAVTGIQEADLVVFTLKETALVPVTFDPEFWEQTVTKLQLFYEEGLLPYLRSMRSDPVVRPEM